MTSRRQSWKRWLGLLLILNLSIAFHVVVMRFGEALLANWSVNVWETPVRIQLLDGDPAAARLRDPLSPLDALPPPLDPDTPAPEEPPEPEIPPQPNGQIVETPPPEVETIPVTADYLAEHDNAVPEEMRSKQYKVNPDVLANIYSKDSKYQTDDVLDVGAKDYSTGATVGGPTPDRAGPGRPRSALPSQWAMTNKEGLAAPTVASSSTQSKAGAPQNDLLKEKVGPAVALNTREFYGADYMNRIRRAVNFYWEQNLDNVSVVISRSQYTTVVDVVVSAAGVLESIEVTHSSGLDPLDNCVVEAFRIAGPFPNPPPQLIAKDGRVYLPDFSFTVQSGRAQMQYQGIDPRSGVQFPGILKSPR